MKKLINYKNKLINQPSLEVQPDEYISDLLYDLDKVATIFQAYGISAVQLGELKQIFLFRKAITDNFKVVINPKIVKTSLEEAFAIEGCLSFPDVEFSILRPIKINVEYYNVKRELVVEELSGLEARVFQHEYDHLVGKTFADNISFMKSQLVKKKINKWIKKHPLAKTVYEIN